MPPSKQENLVWVSHRGISDSGLSLHCNISKSKAHLTLIQQESPCCTSAPASKEWGGKMEAKLEKGITWKNWMYSLAVLHLQKIPTKMLLFLEGSDWAREAWSEHRFSQHTHQYLFLLLGVEIVSLR